jgi:drug/metabolite transporter (DMT)-like permease
MKARPYLLLVCLALVWGIHWPVAKIGLRDIPPFTYGSLRVLLGLVPIVAVLLARHRVRVPARGDIPMVLSVGLGQIAAGTALMNLALPVVAAGRSAILVYTMPLWVALIQLKALRAPGARWRVLGLCAGLTGIALLLNPESIDWQSTGQLLGSAGLLVSAVIWAVTTIHIRVHRWLAGPLDLMPWELLVALVPLVAGAIVLEAGRPIHWEASAVIALTYSGLLATALAFLVSQSISRLLNPLATTIGFLAVPVTGLLASSVLLGEPFTLLDAVGATTTFLGILLVSYAGSAEVAGAPSQLTRR